MLQNILGKSGFIIAGILFLIVAIVPFAAGRILNVAFFVLGIAFLVVRAAAARKKGASTPPMG